MFEFVFMNVTNILTSWDEMAKKYLGLVRLQCHEHQNQLKTKPNP